MRLGTGWILPRERKPEENQEGPAFISGLLTGFLLMLLVGCTSPQLTTPQTIYQMQERYTELGMATLRYVRLPLCPETILYRCSDLTAVRAIQKVDAEVYTVLKAAELARNTSDADAYRQLVASALARLRAELVNHAAREMVQ
ncbi:MAG: hypothetical protein V3V96_15495 [Acidiferrobacterales bacterium]